MGKLKKVVKAALGVTAVNFVGMLLRSEVVNKKMEAHKDENNAMYSVTFAKGNTTLSEDVNNVYLTCLTGSLTATFAEPKNQDINVDLCAVCSKVTLLIPAGVKVVFDGIGRLEKLNDLRTASEGEFTTTLHIYRSVIGAEIVIDYIG